MTPTSHELRTWDREIVWHAFTQMREYEPFIIDRAQGCTLFDLEGREYIDGISSVWCNVHGHRHPRLDEALCNQLNKVAHVTSLGMSNPTSICLAKRLVDLAPDGLNHVFFSDDGTTCVEVALKMAFQYWRQCDHPGLGSIDSASPAGPVAPFLRCQTLVASEGGLTDQKSPMRQRVSISH